MYRSRKKYQDKIQRINRHLSWYFFRDLYMFTCIGSTSLHLVNLLHEICWCPLIWPTAWPTPSDQSDVSAIVYIFLLMCPDYLENISSISSFYILCARGPLAIKKEKDSQHTAWAATCYTTPLPPCFIPFRLAPSLPLHVHLTSRAGETWEIPST